MDKLEDKILQYIISGRAARDRDIDKEIREDPSFDQNEFDLLSTIWSASDQLKNYQRVPHDPAWQNIVREAGIKPEVIKINRTRSWLIAASLVGLVSIGLYFLFQDPFITYQALTAENYVLPDSSTVALEEGSTIRYLKPDQFLSSNSREIYLVGEGLFDVAPDASKPFKVITSLTSVDVLGTRFIYRAEGNFSESENIEGQVRFGTNDGQNQVVLNPGDKVSFDGIALNVERYEPPPPPPPVIPTNNVTLADLIDILGYLYPAVLEFTPSVVYSDVVVPVNLNVSNLDSLIVDLRENPLISIVATKTGPGYLVSTLSAQASGLNADYTYDMFISGVAPKQ